jgi:hypothetical protein
MNKLLIITSGAMPDGTNIDELATATNANMEDRIWRW